MKIEAKLSNGMKEIMKGTKNDKGMVWEYEEKYVKAIYLYGNVLIKYSK